MLFTQPIFLFFFAVVFAVAWTVRDNGRRKLALLAASYVFYAAWDWRFLSLILASTHSSGYQVADVEVHSPSLHHVFLHLTGHELRD